MPVILIEGIDGAGKTTLVNHLVAMSKLKTVVWHRGPMLGTVEEEYIDPLFEMDPKKLYILDRWHVGETVYGPVYRGKSKVQGVYATTIERLLNKLNAAKVILSPALDVCVARMNERGEDYLQPEHYEVVYDAYLKWAEDHADYLVFADNDESVAKGLLVRVGAF